MLLSNASLRFCASFNSALHAEEGHLDPGGGSQRSTLTPTGNLIVAVCLGFIGTFGLMNNLLVLVLYYRYKILRSPINLLLMNISISDLLVCVLGTPFSFAASTQGRWLIGTKGCVWYGFANSLFGIVSLISLAVLSYERYSTMMTPTEADSSNYCKICLGISLSWVYSLIWTLPPLFGWSRYGPEGPGTTCSVNWKAKTANNISYIICLFIFCLIVPLLVIVFCYGKLLCAIRQVRGVNVSMSRKREQRVLFMVVIMVICYLLCWLPYGIMALLATFGPPGLVTPEASIIPSVLAKTSTVINPVIYVFMNKQFYRCFQALLHCEDPRRGSSVKSSSKVATKPMRAGALTGPRCTNDFLIMVASLGQPAAAIPQLEAPLEPTFDVTKAASSDINLPVVVSLVDHLNG
ncbi:vertebrate ancient opsin-like [Corythoichthys intestinalis]|uniref:vertebrate ancient opsin-like n=1 Tax=Corythoichthys intestinalis TaxID=161448 RepID=UPI0025A4E26D|nr:vertebrate ancient opsin-like [Corythoichthys intestinalis]XP_061795131.1 vertebrate ancient opsin-like [Nerophis lumbriciformis]